MTAGIYQLSKGPRSCLFTERVIDHKHGFFFIFCGIKRLPPGKQPMLKKRYQDVYGTPIAHSFWSNWMDWFIFFRFDSSTFPACSLG